MFGDIEATTTTFWGDICLNCIAPPAFQASAVEILFRHEHPLYSSNRARSRATPVVFIYLDDMIPQLQKLREQGSIPPSFHLEPESVERSPPVAKVTSYWSVLELQMFPRLVASYGKDFTSIAEHMGTKTVTMVRNHYQREVGKGGNLDEIARRAECGG